MCFGLLSHLGLFSHTLFAWSWGGHHELTLAALGLAAKEIDRRLVLGRLGVTVNEFKSTLSSLWAMDNCQDLTLGNLVPTVLGFIGHLPLVGEPLRNAGICGVEVPGGQITHFMRDQTGTGADKHTAYRLSYEQIEHTAVRAWELFRKAFPPPEKPHHHHGLLGVLETAYDYTAGQVVKGVKAIVHEEEKLAAEYCLGRALHTLQDSYSPAHTLRVFKEPWTITDIFAYDLTTNREPHAGFPGHPEKDWPGHAILDEPRSNSISPVLFEQAKTASAKLIEAVLGNLFTDRGAFYSELKGVLWKYLAWNF
jgi:hypothetical protein